MTRFLDFWKTEIPALPLVNDVLSGFSNKK
jgi:hypothetical protein